MEIYIGGKRFRLDPTDAIGKGGEADVFRTVPGRVVKVFKQPDHPDYAGSPVEQAGARRRIDVHQKKLPAFPAGLPAQVISPLQLATDRLGTRILGYEMQFLDGAEVLLKYGTRSFRDAGVDNETVLKVFRSLHQTTAGVHGKQVVIGDNNDLNILVHGTDAYLIDADSFQFGPFTCDVFTVDFVDPLCCDPSLTNLMLKKPHSVNSDWYAYSVMLMRSLLFVGPYGGIYRPNDPKKRLTQPERPLHRVTVFHPDVRYPKPAVPYGVLPDELLQHFHLTFEKDKRGVFPLAILESMRWTRCMNCGIEHARVRCPECAAAAPAAVKEAVRVRGTVSSARIFATTGSIVYSTVQDGKMRWLYHENNAFKREDGSIAIASSLDPQMRFRISGDRTAIGKGNQVAVVKGNSLLERKAVDSFGNIPMFDANSSHFYWSAEGELRRDDTIADLTIGAVLAKQTLFWVGQEFGFGLYRAGNYSVAFVFNAESRGINDSVKLPPLRGQLVDAICAFTSQLCWFFTATQNAGVTTHAVTVVGRDGKVLATAESPADDEAHWLHTIRGHAATGNFLFIATDEGIVRLKLDNGQLVRDKEYPDTEPFVNAGCSLHVSPKGLYVVDRKEVRLLTIS